MTISFFIVIIITPSYPKGTSLAGFLHLGGSAPLEHILFSQREDSSIMLEAFLAIIYIREHH